MNPEDIPQMLRDMADSQTQIADMLEQILGGGQGGQQGQGGPGGQAPDLEAMAAAPQGGGEQ